MSTTALDMRANGQAPQGSTATWLRLAVIWHVVLALGGLVGLGALWVFFSDALILWQRVLISVILAGLTFSSALAAYWIGAMVHRGRVISLVINYLGFLFGVAAFLQIIGAFTGLDALAETFPRGLPFLALLLVGFYLTRAGSDWSDATRRLASSIGRLIMIVGGVALLFAVGLVDGVQAALSRFDDPVPFLLIVGFVLFGLFLRAMWRQPTADAFGATVSDAESLSGFLFLSPNLLGFLVFFAGPLLLSLYVSFTDWDAFSTANWVGLANYAEIFNLRFATLASADQLASEVLNVQVYDELTRFGLFGRNYIIGAADKLFWLALGNTLQYVLLVVPLSVVPALFLANLLNSKLPGMKFFRAAYFLPSVAAVVGIALIWQWLYNATVGYINYFITLGVDFLNTLLSIAITDPQIRWTSESDTALLAVVIMAAWQMIGFNTVLFLAGLQSIPGTLYEAATVDGANSWQRFWRITLPLLAPTTFFVVTTTLIRAMQVFEEVFILMGQYPAGPGNSTLTMVLYLYQKGFQRFEQGYASAIAWVLFLLIFGATLFQFQRQRGGGTTYDV